MEQNTPQCAYCDRSSEEVPLIALKYRQQVSWICPQHLPVLIHKPQKLIGKIPGVDNLKPEGQGH